MLLSPSRGYLLCLLLLRWCYGLRWLASHQRRYGCRLRGKVGIVGHDALRLEFLQRLSREHLQEHFLPFLLFVVDDMLCHRRL